MAFRTGTRHNRKMEDQNGMVWKTETMYQLQLKWPEKSKAKFEFEQSKETGGDRFSWKARAKPMESNIRGPRPCLIIALRSLNTNCEGKVTRKSCYPVPKERLSVKVETATETTIFEGTQGPAVAWRWDFQVRRDPYPYYSWHSIYLKDNYFHDDETIIVTFMLKTKISIVKEKFYKMITKLENDAENSDIKIISSDGKEFFAYRWILADVSDVFEAMFRCDMSEKQSGVLKMDDLSAATVKTLLHFMYTREVVPPKESSGSSSITMMELMYAADKYQIEDLKNILDTKLGKMMICNLGNARDLRAMAKTASLKKAVGDISRFIKHKSREMYEWSVDALLFTEKGLTGFKRRQEVKFMFPFNTDLEPDWKAELTWYKKKGKILFGVTLEQRHRKKKQYGKGERANISVLIGNTFGTRPKILLGEASFVKLWTCSKYQWAEQRFSDEWLQAMELNGGELVITFILVNSDISPRAIIATQNDKDKLYRMIGKLENDEENYDVKIISSDGKEFYAYRWILSEVSSVLKLRLNSDIEQTETETGVVKFNDLCGATVQLVLHFIYTEEIGSDWSEPGILEELMFAAMKYKIVKLKEDLDSYLGNICTIESARNLLSLAQKYSMNKAVTDIMAFMGENAREEP